MSETEAILEKLAQAVADLGWDIAIPKAQNGDDAIHWMIAGEEKYVERFADMDDACIGIKNPAAIPGLVEAAKEALRWVVAPMLPESAGEYLEQERRLPFIQDRLKRALAAIDQEPEHE